MKIEEGKWYKRREGTVIGPARSITSFTDRSWLVGISRYPSNGRFYGDQEHAYDLVEEAPAPGAVVGPAELLADLHVAEQSQFEHVEVRYRDGSFYSNKQEAQVAQKAKTTKAGLLDAAKAAVADRGLNYGRPEDNFGRIARLWNAHLANRHLTPEDMMNGAGLTPNDVAQMMVLMKIARLENDPSHLDSWTDLAGYAACGAEISA